MTEYHKGGSFQHFAFPSRSKLHLFPADKKGYSMDAVLDAFVRAGDMLWDSKDLGVRWQMSQSTFVNAKSQIGPFLGRVIWASPEYRTPGYDERGNSIWRGPKRSDFHRGLPRTFMILGPMYDGTLYSNVPIRLYHEYEVTVTDLHGRKVIYKQFAHSYRDPAFALEAPSFNQLIANFQWQLLQGSYKTAPES